MPVCINDLGPHLLAIILMDVVRKWLVTPYEAPADRVSRTRRIQRSNGITLNQTRSWILRYGTSHRVRFPIPVLVSHSFKDAWTRACTLVPISLHVELTAGTNAKRQKDGAMMAKRMAEMLQKFPSTTRLRLQCTNQTMAVAILPSFSKFKCIRYINLNGTALDDDSVAKLAEKLSRINKHLVGINIQCTQAGDRAVKELVWRFPGLETIACGGDLLLDGWIESPVSVAVLKYISQLPRLRVIDIQDMDACYPGNEVPNEVEDSLHVLTQSCEHIQHLRFNVNPITCGVMNNIAKFKFLKSLDVEQAGFAEDISTGLIHVIENCKMLHTLKLRASMLTDEVFEAMVQSQLKIIRIVFSGREIDWRFESFEKLKECTDLVKLSLITGHQCAFDHPDAAKYVGVACEISQKNMFDTSHDENDDTELFESESHLGHDQLPYIKV